MTAHGAIATTLLEADPRESASQESASQPGQVQCGVIIVTYNSAGHIASLLDSLADATAGLSIRTVVVDNGSQDGTVQRVRRAGVQCVESGANLGYAGAINLGRSHVGACSSILVLNADLVLEPGCVVALFAALRLDAVGVVVPQLLDDRGSVYRSLRREPTIRARPGGRALRRPLPPSPELGQRDGPRHGAVSASPPRRLGHRSGHAHRDRL